MQYLQERGRREQGSCRQRLGPRDGAVVICCDTGHPDGGGETGDSGETAGPMARTCVLGHLCGAHRLVQVSGYVTEHEQ